MALEVNCKDCGRVQINLDLCELEYKWTDTHEGQHDWETQYNAETEIKYPECGKPMKVEVELWEYPIRTFDGVIVTVDGTVYVDAEPDEYETDYKNYKHIEHKL